MALDHLLAALERDAATEVERITAAAQADTETIRAEADRRLGARRADALGAREAEARAAAAASLGEVRRRARAEVLAARQHALERVFAAAGRALPDAGRRAGYLAALPAELAAALACVGDSASVIRCAPSLAATIKPLVRDRAACRVEPDRAIGAGFIVATTDGVIEVDATLAGRLERLRDHLALEILRQLEQRR
jgi:vacuolar-type H+-ATPase subunit E/Vma4